MASHRSQIARPEDFDCGKWKLKIFRHRDYAVIKCAVCHPRKRITERKLGQILDLLNEDTDETSN